MDHTYSIKSGKRHAYSNLGYLILGKVIERVTGMPYVDFIREIYKPIPVVPGHGKQSNCHSLEVKYYNNRDNILESSIYPGEGLVQTQYGALRMEGTESYGGWVMSAPELLQLFNYISSGSKKLLCEESFKLMIKKPSYELGHQWYGLGLDVQDNDLSWGHTGAMDGTSTTIHHHKSGLTWALLFNSWSKDMDLDGLVKYGLAMIPSLPLWIQDTVIDQFFVKSEYQFVYLLMPYEKFCHVINLCDNYYLSHVNMIRYGGSLCVNSVWTKSQFKHIVFIDKNISDVQPIFKKCNLCYSYVYLLESYKFGNDVYYIVGLQEKPVRICQEIYIHLNATLHLNQIKSMKAQGYVLRLQTVVVLLGSLFVSSVYDKEDLSESKSWLQITLENFVVELGKNSVKNLAPLYTNCYSVDDEPYMSATWVPGKDKQFFQRHDVSIYGFLYEIQDSKTNNVYVDKICAYYNDGVLNFLGVWSSEL